MCGILVPTIHSGKHDTGVNFSTQANSTKQISRIRFITKVKFRICWLVSYIS